jgi:hypothetical protein
LRAAKQAEKAENELKRKEEITAHKAERQRKAEMLYKAKKLP